MENLKATLIDALKESNYEVKIQEPNNASIREKYDGSKYIYLRGDDMKFSADCGYCTITILGHPFTCDLTDGEWSAEQESDKELLEDEEFVEAVENADGVIAGEMWAPEDQAEVFCRANNMENNLPVFWRDDDDVPKDLDNLDLYDPVLWDVYVSIENGDEDMVNCEFQCSSVYRLYRSLNETEDLYKEPMASSDYIKSKVPELHEEIFEEMKIKWRKNLKDANYSLENTRYFFESILG